MKGTAYVYFIDSRIAQNGQELSLESLNIFSNGKFLPSEKIIESETKPRVSCSQPGLHPGIK